MIARHSETLLQLALGFRDRDAASPMAVDSVFRIASMTKPLTCVAALMLAEEGKLLIADPVARYLPEFEHVKVGLNDSAGALTLVDPARPMTVQDLMRHTSGLTYGFFGASPLRTMYNEAGVFSFDNTNAEMVTKLARLPLAYHPGTTFDYGMSTDVLGRIVEVLSGQTLGDFLRERLLAPLGMSDTGFAVPHAGGRIAEPDPTTNNLLLTNPLIAPRWEAGGAGLASTAPDYLRFCHMLLNEGHLDGRRYLAPSSIRLMASDHLPPGVAYDPITLPLLGAGAPMPAMGHGYGLGVGVRTRLGGNPLPGSLGTFSWGGALGTTFWIDPQQQLVVILMTQAPAERIRYRSLLQQLVYQALV